MKLKRPLHVVQTPDLECLVAGAREESFSVAVGPMPRDCAEDFVRMANAEAAVYAALVRTKIFAQAIHNRVDAWAPEAREALDFIDAALKALR